MQHTCLAGVPIPAQCRARQRSTRSPSRVPAVARHAPDRVVPHGTVQRSVHPLTRPATHPAPAPTLPAVRGRHTGSSLQNILEVPVRVLLVIGRTEPRTASCSLASLSMQGSAQASSARAGAARAESRHRSRACMVPRLSAVFCAALRHYHGLSRIATSPSVQPGDASDAWKPTIWDRARRRRFLAT